MRGYQVLMLVACLGTTTERASSSEFSPPDRGIIHFYEPKVEDRPAPDLKDPLVAGAEGIFWWGDLEPQEGAFDWDRVDREIQHWQSAGKQLDIRLAAAHNAPDMTPAWLFNEYHVRRIGRGCWYDAEEPSKSYSLEGEGHLSTNSAEVIGGKCSVTAHNSRDGAATLLRMHDSAVLAPNLEYSIQFDCRSSNGAKGWVALINTQTFTTNLAEFLAPAGGGASFTFSVHTPDATGSQIVWGLNGVGDLGIDNINIMTIQPMPDIVYDGAEGGLKYWTLGADARITHDAALLLSGGSSILVSNANQDFGVAIRNNQASFPIVEGQGYSAGFEFKALTTATMRLQLISKTQPLEVLDKQTFTLKPGDQGHHKWYFPAFVWRENTALEIGLVGPGAVVIDNLRWSRWSDRVTCFPDYFNPVFRQKWENFVTAFAARYSNHPGVGHISVGGFGRWEEVILDDDVPGILDTQWLARGFTTERYLDHVTWCMDLYKRLFPAKPLRICLAYGLKKQNDVDLMYRRVAQAAVKRGIGLKQNGLSERYDTWDEYTSASYLFNRYRFKPGVSLTYETGGQISRVARHFSDGHPLSVLNRGMIDGTDFLFLYVSDINARHVHKYLGYTSEMLGAPLITTFFSRLGDYSLVMEHTPAPQDYRNQWLGLREFATDGADPQLTELEGQRCAMTRPDASHIVFDVDDRQQYHGMFGATFTVEYLDEGTDDLEVNCYNNWTQEWEKLGHITKKGSGGWKTASFMKPDWCRSSRGDGEDVHADIAINDLGDGCEYIAGAELAFVPAREWQREMIQASEPADHHEIVHDTLTREIELPDGQPINFVSVPLWTGNWQRNGVRGRVIALTDKGEVVASEKTYAMPADKDWFEMPLTPVPHCRRYRIELSKPVGSVGWYCDAPGRPAYRAARYRTAPNKTVGKALQSGPTTSIAFQAEQPFCGLAINSVEGFPRKGVRAQLRRHLGNNTWSEPIGSQQVRLASHPPEIYFEPQTAGKYKLELLAAGVSTAQEPLNAAFDITLLQLQRLLPPNGSIAPRGTNATTIFSPSSGASNSSLRLSKFATCDRPAGDDLVALQITDALPGLEFEIMPPITASSGDRIKFNLANQSGLPLARIYWREAGQDFSTGRSVVVPLVQNDPVLRQYEFPIGLEKKWEGKLAAFRFEFLGLDVRSGAVKIGNIAVTHGPSL